MTPQNTQTPVESMTSPEKYRLRHRRAISAKVAKWRIANPEKHRAHNAVVAAIRRGDMKRPNVCSECSKKGIIHAHHEDYSKPLAVIWLCPKCHHAKHGWKPNSQFRGGMGKFSPVKLNPESVVVIRSLADSGKTYASLARQFNVSETNIRLIARREIWRSVK